STARTEPPAPTRSQSHRVIDPPPAPTSRHRHPGPTPIASRYRVVAGSWMSSSAARRVRACSQALSSWYSAGGVAGVVTSASPSLGDAALMMARMAGRSPGRAQGGHLGQRVERAAGVGRMADVAPGLDLA